MSRPLLLVFLFLILIITSQFEWKQPLMSDIDAIPGESQKQQQISKREEAVIEKIILSQERVIQKLNELVGNLRKQLQQCRVNNETTDNIVSTLTENIIELGRQQFAED